MTLHWSRCVEHVKTDWFIILGDDDALDIHAINEFYQNLSTYAHFNVLRFCVLMIDKRNNPISNIITYQDEENSSDFLMKKIKNQVRNTLGEYVFRKTDFEKYGIKYYPKAIYSDNWMTTIYSQFGKIKNIEKGIVKIRKSEFCLSGNTNNKIVICKAGYLFYRDIISHYGCYFRKVDKIYIRNYLIKRF